MQAAGFTQLTVGTMLPQCLTTPSVSCVGPAAGVEAWPVHVCFSCSLHIGRMVHRGQLRWQQCVTTGGYMRGVAASKGCRLSVPHSWLVEVCGSSAA
jgi:hypothetical protein